MKIFKYFYYVKKYIDEKHSSAKISYLLFSIYFFVLGVIGLINNETYLALSIILISLFMLFLPFCDILVFYKLARGIFVKFSLFFQKLLIEVENKFLEQKTKKIPPKLAFKRFFYMFLFFLLPLGFAFLIINGQWYHGLLEGSSGVSFGLEEAVYYEVDRGQINIKPVLEQDFLVKLSYLLGDIFNIPILDVCFINNGTIYEEDTLIDTFASKVYLNSVYYNVPFKEKVCIELKVAEQIIQYEWTTEYKYVFDEREIIGNNVDVSSSAKNSVFVTINSNFWIMFMLLALAWMAICHLIYSVIKNFNQIT